MRAEQERLAVFHVNVGFLELRPARAHGFDLPAMQHEAGLVALLDEIVEARLAVLGNEAGSFGCGLAMEQGATGWPPRYGSGVRFWCAIVP